MKCLLQNRYTMRRFRECSCSHRHRLIVRQWKSVSTRLNASLNTIRSNNRCALKSVLLMALIQPALANANEPDWPCIQAFVPVVELGVLWPQVVPESDLGQWKDDEKIESLAQKLGNLAEYTDADREMVEQFIDAIPEADKSTKLNQLAEGTLAVSNKRRTLYINGIKKYTRQQSAIAKQIEDGLNTLAQMEQDNVQSAERDELQETMNWHQRVFDQREHSMIALCDQPVLVEQITSDVLRDLAQYLP